jgi:hypothetical protein
MQPCFGEVFLLDMSVVVYRSRRIFQTGASSLVKRLEYLARLSSNVLASTRHRPTQGP